MKILVTANDVSGKASKGGSSRLMKCVIDELVAQGHIVTTAVEGSCDVAIFSHYIDTSISAKKVFISQGIVDAERALLGADKYVSISEEVRHFNKVMGFHSEVIGQPIKILEQKQINKTLKNILIIRRDETLIEDSFEFLNKLYSVTVSDPEIPIEEQIRLADLCITLGRGALESMAQGVPVLIADNRDYQGAIGDGYVNEINIKEIAKHNFSGRRFHTPLSQEWILSELQKYDANDSNFLYEYVSAHHNVEDIVKEYLKDTSAVPPDETIAFGCIYNNVKRLDLILKKSCIGESPCFTVYDPEFATKGLNMLLDTIDHSGADIGILTHNDMFYQEHWLPQVRSQLAKLPEDWVIAGVVGKDEKGLICGKFHDMSSPLWVHSAHDFPVRCSCIDECTIIVNMKSGFRFDEELIGFDLYGTYACLKANEMGSAWIIDAWAEHYCTRFFGQWEPDEVFMQMWRWLYNRFPGKRLESTVLLGKDL